MVREVQFHLGTTRPGPDHSAGKYDYSRTPAFFRSAGVIFR